VFADPGLTKMLCELALTAVWASVAFLALFMFVVAPRRPPRLWLATILLVSFGVGGSGRIVCDSYCTSLGGFARAGGVDGRGVYHLRNRNIDTPVIPEVYRRADRFERIGDAMAAICFLSFLVMIAWAFVAERLRLRRERQSLSGAIGP
jgi:hypothetical protein